MIDKTYFENLETALKLVDKYHLEELTLPDGTKITKKMHLGKPMPKKKIKPLPVSTFNPDDTLFLTTPAPKLPMGMFNRYGVDLTKKDE